MITTVTFRHKSTIARITGEERFIAVAKNEIVRRYAEVEEYCVSDPAFQTTLEPYSVPADASQIVREMTTAAARCGVGPMAAVAGAIARYAVIAMQKAGATHAIVDNGGDIAMLNDRPIVVGIYTGPAEIRDLGLRFPARSKLTGVCTSSGVIGHSLSFGSSHASIILCEDPILADAAATALGNRIRSKDPAGIENAMNAVLEFGVAGCIVIIDDYFGFAGEIPEICRIEMNEELIAK